jgi:hypothetical protein
MREERLEGHHGRAVTIDLCVTCQAFWFDGRESLSLTPGSTLALFRLIGEHAVRPGVPSEAAACPRCGGRLRRAHDRQRATRFEYLTCPDGHGRFTTFFNFLREKDFVRPLTPAHVAELRRSVQMVNCSNCGGAVDLAHASACAHCGSPLSMLDMAQAEALVARLQQAEDRSRRPVDPALPLELARARLQVETTFAALERDQVWRSDAGSLGLVGAGLHAVARWLRRQV